VPLPVPSPKQQNFVKPNLKIQKEYHQTLVIQTERAENSNTNITGIYYIWSTTNTIFYFIKGTVFQIIL